MRPALLLRCYTSENSTDCLIRDLTVPSDSVYGYSDIHGEERGWGYMGRGLEICFEEFYELGLEVFYLFLQIYHLFLKTLIFVNLTRPFLHML